MTDKKTILEFPCSFPLKVMGKNRENFPVLVRSILQKHVGDLHDTAFTSRLSNGGKYNSITITFTAQSQEQLDALYEELSRHEDVLMVL